MAHPSDDNLLSVARVLQLLEDRDRDAEEVRRAQARLDESQRRLDAVEVLIGRNRLDEIATSAKRAAGPVSRQAAAIAQGVEMAWTDWILIKLKELGGVATSQTLIDAARADPKMRDRFARTPNGYYNGIARVVSRDQAKKSGKLIALFDANLEEYEAAANKAAASELFQ